MALPVALFLKILDSIGKLASERLDVFNVPKSRGVGILVDEAIRKIAGEQKITLKAAGKLLGENLQRALLKLKVPETLADRILGKAAAKKLFLQGVKLGVPEITVTGLGLGALAETIIFVVIISVLVYLAGALLVFIRDGVIPFTFEKLVGNAKIIIGPGVEERKLEEAIITEKGETLQLLPFKGKAGERLIKGKLAKIPGTKPKKRLKPAGEKVSTFLMGHRRVTQFRLDVIGFRDDTNVDLVEIKRKANGAAIGQVLTYTHLWKKDHPGINVRMVIVAEDIHPDLFEVAAAYDVTLIEV